MRSTAAFVGAIARVEFLGQVQLVSYEVQVQWKRVGFESTIAARVVQR